jgi:hypothetical protein
VLEDRDEWSAFAVYLVEAVNENTTGRIVGWLGQERDTATMW